MARRLSLAGSTRRPYRSHHSRSRTHPRNRHPQSRHKDCRRYRPQGHPLSRRQRRQPERCAGSYRSKRRRQSAAIACRRRSPTRRTKIDRRHEASRKPKCHSQGHLPGISPNKTIERPSPGRVQPECYAISPRANTRKRGPIERSVRPHRQVSAWSPIVRGRSHRAPPWPRLRRKTPAAKARTPHQFRTPRS
jgi:hypothetical protein